MDNKADTQYVGEENTDENNDGLHKILKYKAVMTFEQYIAQVDNQN